MTDPSLPLPGRLPTEFVRRLKVEQDLSVLRALDKNGDAKISPDEFHQKWQKAHPQVLEHFILTLDDQFLAPDMAAERADIREARGIVEQLAKLNPKEALNFIQQSLPKEMAHIICSLLPTDSRLALARAQQAHSTLTDATLQKALFASLGTEDTNTLLASGTSSDVRILVRYLDAATPAERKGFLYETLSVPNWQDTPASRSAGDFGKPPQKPFAPHVRLNFQLELLRQISEHTESPEVVGLAISHTSKLETYLKRLPNRWPKSPTGLAIAPANQELVRNQMARFDKMSSRELAALPRKEKNNFAYEVWRREKIVKDYSGHGYLPDAEAVGADITKLRDRLTAVLARDPVGTVAYMNDNPFFLPTENLSQALTSILAGTSHDKLLPILEKLRTTIHTAPSLEERQKAAYALGRLCGAMIDAAAKSADAAKKDIRALVVGLVVSLLPGIGKQSDKIKAFTYSSQTEFIESSKKLMQHLHHDLLKAKVEDHFNDGHSLYTNYL